MDAFHTLRLKQTNAAKGLEDFELFFMLMSALKWQEKNGKIYLVTDDAGAEYVYKHGLAPAYDHIDLSLNNLRNYCWSEDVFWAGAKIYALAQQLCPCVMVDLDFVVWETIDFLQYGKDIACIHREDVNTNIYPDINYFTFKNGWSIPAGLDWNVSACNTALAYFGSKELVKEYTDFAFSFMESADVYLPDLPYMVFVEQRWLAMCAMKMGRKINALATFDYLFGDSQEIYTHLWGHKEIFRKNHAKAKSFCNQCLKRICDDFPTWGEKLLSERWSSKYFV